MRKVIARSRRMVVHIKKIKTSKKKKKKIMKCNSKRKITKHRASSFPICTRHQAIPWRHNYIAGHSSSMSSRCEKYFFFFLNPKRRRRGWKATIIFYGSSSSHPGCTMLRQTISLSPDLDPTSERSVSKPDDSDYCPRHSIPLGHPQTSCCLPQKRISSRGFEQASICNRSL